MIIIKMNKLEKKEKKKQRKIFKKHKKKLLEVGKIAASSPFEYCELLKLFLEILRYYQELLNANFSYLKDYNPSKNKPYLYSYSLKEVVDILVDYLSIYLNGENDIGCPGSHIFIIKFFDLFREYFKELDIF